jgi:hypothetical protein
MKLVMSPEELREVYEAGIARGRIEELYCGFDVSPGEGRYQALIDYLVDRMNEQMEVDRELSQPLN